TALYFSSRSFQTPGGVYGGRSLHSVSVTGPCDICMGSATPTRVDGSCDREAASKARWREARSSAVIFGARGGRPWPPNLGSTAFLGFPTIDPVLLRCLVPLAHVADARHPALAGAAAGTPAADIAASLQPALKLPAAVVPHLDHAHRAAG